MTEKDPSSATSAFEILFISKSLERIADHAVNISKEVVFMATSVDVRHAPEYKKSVLKKIFHQKDEIEAQNIPKQITINASCNLE